MRSTLPPGPVTWAIALVLGGWLAAAGTSQAFLLGDASAAAAGEGPFAVAAADLDGDGAVDLVVSNYGAHSVSVLRGRGDGTFAAPVEYGPVDTPRGVTLGDFDGDGDLDMAVCRSWNDDVAVLLGNGDATFGSPALHPTGGTWAYQVRAADLNADGALDLVVSHSYYVGAGVVGVLLGAGDGTFGAPVTYAVGPNPSDLVLGDLDNDGALDAVVTNTSQLNSEPSISVLRGNGDGTFGPAAAYPVPVGPHAAALGDLDGDGWSDVVVADLFGSRLCIFRNQGGAVLGQRADFDLPFRPGGVLVADLDRDGDLDVAVADVESGRLLVFRGRGDGALLAPVESATLGGAVFPAAADLNGDGVLDLAVPASPARAVAVLLGTGAWREDFEGYAHGTVGPREGGWVLQWEGVGQTQQYVDGSQAAAGSSSLHLWGAAGWSANVFHLLPIAPRVALEASVYVRDNASCAAGGNAHLGLWNPVGGPWGMAYGRLTFSCNKIWAETVYGGSANVEIADYATAQWVRTRVEYDFVARSFDVFVNGSLAAVGLPIGDGGHPTSVALTAGNGTDSEAWFDEIRVEALPADTIPDTFSFEPVAGAARAAVVESGPVTVAGIDAGAPVAVAGGEYSIDGGVWSSAPSTVGPGAVVRVRLTSSASFSAEVRATLIVGGVSADFAVTTLAADATPETFVFPAVNDVVLGQVVTSEGVTVAGINTDAPVTVAGGEYSVNGGAWTATDGAVADGDVLRVRVTAPASFSATGVATLTVGGVSAEFSVTTLAADPTPDAFGFAEVAGAEPGALVVSAAVAVAGINTDVPVSVSGGQWRRNSGPWTDGADTVRDGDTVQVSLRAPEQFAAAAEATLTIGGVSAVFRVTTADALPASEDGSGGGGGCFLTSLGR